MIRIYTEKVLSEDWIIFNDAFFNLFTSNEDLTEKDIQYVQLIDNAKVTADNHIESKYGIGTIRNLSSGCTTMMNL